MTTKNITKGCNKLQKFERDGTLHKTLLEKLIRLLELDAQTVEQLIERDKQEEYVAQNQLLDEPIELKLQVCMTRRFGKTIRIPERVNTPGEAFQFARTQAKHYQSDSFLRLSRRVTLIFNSRGEFINVREQKVKTD